MKPFMSARDVLKNVGKREKCPHPSPGLASPPPLVKITRVTIVASPSPTISNAKMGPPSPRIPVVLMPQVPPAKTVIPAKIHISVEVPQPSQVHEEVNLELSLHGHVDEVSSNPCIDVLAEEEVEPDLADIGEDMIKMIEKVDLTL